jgi:putative transposase
MAAFRAAHAPGSHSRCASPRLRKQPGYCFINPRSNERGNPFTLACMPQSLAKVYIHLIFSTKGREKLILRHLHPELHEYMGGILRDLGCTVVEINTEPDHAHLLFLLSRTETLGDIVRQVKTGSTEWLQKQLPILRNFHWQNGYGAFSVSQSNLAEVKEYILNQQRHHQVMSFQEEFRRFLAKYEVEYDERYVWD